MNVRPLFLPFNLVSQSLTLTEAHTMLNTVIESWGVSFFKPPPLSDLLFVLASSILCQAHIFPLSVPTASCQ